MRTFPALFLAATALSVSAAPPEPLVEVKRIELEPPFEEAPGNVCFHPEAPVGYAASSDRLITFDATTGTSLGVVPLDSLDDRYESHPWQVAIVAGRLLAWSYAADSVSLYDVDDPAAPTLLHADVGTWKRPLLVATLDAGYFVLRHDDNRYDLFAIEPFGPVAPIPQSVPGSRVDSVTTPGGPGAAPALVVVERNNWSPPLSAIAVYDVVDGAPVQRFSRVGTASVGSIAVDRTGEVLVSSFYVPTPAYSIWTESIDARTGATLATWDGGSYWWRAFAEGRDLLQADTTGIDLVDLSDPSDPVPAGRIESPVGSYSDRRRAFVSSRAPVVFVAGANDDELHAFDARTAAEIGSVPVEGGEPVGLVVQETSSGLRRGAVAVRHADTSGVTIRGGLSHLELFELTNAAAPAKTGRLLRNHPAGVVDSAAIGEGHVLAYDAERNSLALVDLTEGKVVQVTGAAGLLWDFDDFGLPSLRTAGRIALVAGPRGWERFALVRGRLQPLDAHVFTPFDGRSPEGALLTADGTVIDFGWWDEGGKYVWEVETVGIDGRSGRFASTQAVPIVPDVSPRGDLFVLARPGYRNAHAVDVVDVSDPSAPTILWSLNEDVSDAAFDPTGTRLVVSGPWDGFQYWTRVFDARTGTPLGPKSEGFDKYFFHGLGAQWIADGAWRAVYWKWSVLAWDVDLVDLSGPAPTLVRTYPDVGFPDFAPRPGGGWYEALRGGGQSLLIVGAPDGEIAPTEVFEADHSRFSVPRRGFVATVRREGRRLGISLWRDDALLRPAAKRPH